MVVFLRWSRWLAQKTMQTMESASPAQQHKQKPRPVRRTLSRHVQHCCCIQNNKATSLTRSHALGLFLPSLPLPLPLPLPLLLPPSTFFRFIFLCHAGVFVTKVDKGSPAHIDGRLKPGLQVSRPFAIMSGSKQTKQDMRVSACACP